MLESDGTFVRMDGLLDPAKFEAPLIDDHINVDCLRELTHFGRLELCLGGTADGPSGQ